MRSDRLALYDRIGLGYTATRRPDPRIAAVILDALGDAAPVVNVGGWCGRLRAGGQAAGRGGAVGADHPAAAAYWQRPWAYLDPGIRSGMSGFALLDQNVVERGVRRLRDDLESGAWERRFGHLLSLDSLDVCYRLVVTSDGAGEKRS